MERADAGRVGWGVRWRGTTMDHSPEEIQRILQGVSEDELADFREVFAQFDKNNSGDITWDEYKAVLELLGQSPTEREMKELVAEGDIDGVGGLNFQEFLIHMLGLAGGIAEKQYASMFKVLETVSHQQGQGKIKIESMQRIISMLCKELSDADVRNVLHEYDRDGNGELDFSEFKQLMSNM